MRCPSRLVWVAGATAAVMATALATSTTVRAAPHACPLVSARTFTRLTHVQLKPARYQLVLGPTANADGTRSWGCGFTGTHGTAYQVVAACGTQTQAAHVYTLKTAALRPHGATIKKLGDRAYGGRLPDGKTHLESQLGNLELSITAWRETTPVTPRTQPTDVSVTIRLARAALNFACP